MNRDTLNAISALVSSSSSSSSSDDDEFIVHLLLEKTKKSRVENFAAIARNYSEIEFREQFRLLKATAQTLIDRYEESTHFKKKEGGGGKPEIPAETQMYMFLWFAANKDSYREVANLFNVSISSTYRTISNILDFIFEISPNYIKFPSTEEEKIHTATKFEQISGFPNVLGCIDGSYIYIRKPANKIRSTYINRHDLLSLTLQGICDSDMRFIDVFVGAPSKIHDARVFELSFISKDLPQTCGSQYHILGDAAYPLREYLLTPYKDTGSMTTRKRNYNKIHSQTRVRIENSFGLLKTRFRQMMRLDFQSVERMCKFIMACCVLHNMCIDRGDLWAVVDESIHENSTNPGEIQTQPNHILQRLGDIKRNAIADSF